MKSLTLFVVLIFFAFIGNGQSLNIDSCGLDASRILNSWEIRYFKENIRTLRDIDIEGKKFAFAYGNYGNKVINKKEYFEKWGRDYYNKNFGVSNILISLNKEEKQRSGGYDYIIISWSKTLPARKSRNRLIERIKEYSEINAQ